MLIGCQFVPSGIGDVQDLAADRQHRLGVAITCLLCRAACRIAFDDEELGTLRIVRGAVRELARQPQIALRGGGLSLHLLFGAPAKSLIHAFEDEAEQRFAALLIIGEDYGEGSSIMQERSHSFATKSQVWLLDPRPNHPSIVKAVKDGFALSEASNTPVMLEVRIRACHVTGSFEASDNIRPDLTVRDALEAPRRKTDRVVLPPASYQHEHEKIEKRLPAAKAFIAANRLNEHFGPEDGPVGIILQGGMYNGVNRALERLGLSDLYGDAQLPVHGLNVAYPHLGGEVTGVRAGRRAVQMGRGSRRERGGWVGGSCAGRAVVVLGCVGVVVRLGGDHHHRSRTEECENEDSDGDKEPRRRGSGCSRCG